MTSHFTQDTDEEGDGHPSDAAAAALPRILGGGCLARFDPDALNGDSGADFSALWPVKPTGATDKQAD